MSVNVRPCVCGFEMTHNCTHAAGNRVYYFSNDGAWKDGNGFTVAACNPHLAPTPMPAVNTPPAFVVPPKVAAKYVRTDVCAASDAKLSFSYGWELIAVLPQYPHEPAYLIGITAEVNKRMENKYKEQLRRELEQVKADHILSIEFRDKLQRSVDNQVMTIKSLRADLNQTTNDLKSALTKLDMLKSAIGSVQYQKILDGGE